MTPQSSCKYNGHGFNDDGVCIYCHEDDGTQTTASDEMTQPNQSELREQVLTEFKQVYRLAPADYTENCTNVVMSIVEAYITANYTPNSEVEQLKSRIAWLEGKIEGLSNDNLTPHLTPHLTPKKLPRFEP
jgi:cytochrome c553